MEVGSELVGLVAEGDFDVAEQLVIGDIDESLGHLSGGLFQAREDLLGEFLNASFAVIRGLQRLRIVGVQHGCHLTVKDEGPEEFPSRIEFTSTDAFLHLLF